MTNANVFFSTTLRRDIRVDLERNPGSTLEEIAGRVGISKYDVKTVLDALHGYVNCQAGKWSML